MMFASSLLVRIELLFDFLSWAVAGLDMLRIYNTLDIGMQAGMAE